MTEETKNPNWLFSGDFNSNSYSYSDDPEYDYRNEIDIEEFIELYYDLKNRFPYFLGDRAERFIEFIFNDITYQFSPPRSFLYENKRELYVTLNVLNVFLKERKMNIIKENRWAQFCYSVY